jgi:hypothetical protein
MKTKYLRSLIILLPLLSLLGACNRKQDLKAVEDFALTSEKIKTASGLVIADIHGSCVRREELSNQANSLVNEPVFDEKGKPILPLINIRERCQKWLRVVSETNQVNDVVISYMQTLGRLASNDTVTFTTNVQNLNNSVVNLSQVLNATGANITIGEKQQQAAVRIVNSTLNIWSTQFRHQNLKPALICTDPYFAQYTSLLGEIIDKIYLQIQLTKEESALNFKYNLAYRVALKNSGFNPAVLGSAIIDLQNSYRQDIGAFDQRKQAAIAYIQLLNNTQALHHALANTFRGNDTDIVVEILCKNYFKEPESIATKPSSEITPKQLNKAQDLLKDYHKSVTPLLEKIVPIQVNH